MEKKKKAVALSSVFASLFLTLLKLVVGLLTGSIGILSEAAHSGLDFAAAFITYISVRISGEPADFTHHYGHGKVESFSALIETGLLVLTSGWIIYESVHRLLNPSVEVQVTWYAFAIMFISIIVDITRSRQLSKVAKETNSQALAADALHFQSDILSSAVVIVGLVFVSFGRNGADAIAAIGVAILVLFASYRLGKETIDVLLDKAPKGMAEHISEVTNKIDGVTGVERVRVRPAGPSYFIDMIVNVSRKTPIETVHEITRKIEENIKNEIKDADVIIHVKPVAIEGETVIERIQTIAINHGMTAHDIFVHKANGKRIINFNLETNSKLSISRAHNTVNKIEDAVRSELGKDIDINIHIEPTTPSTLKAEEVKPGEIESIKGIIEKIQEYYPYLRDIHNISVYTINKKLYISIHTVFDNRLPLVKAHNISNEIEEEIKRKIPDVEHVLVHMESKDHDKGKASNV